MAKPAVGQVSVRRGLGAHPRPSTASPPRATGLRQRATARRAKRNGAPANGTAALSRLEEALHAAAGGEFGIRLRARRKDEIGRLEAAYNELAARNAALEAEILRVGQSIGR